MIAVEWDRPGPDVRSPLVAVFVGTDHHRFDRLLSWVRDCAAEGWAEWFVQHGATPWQPTVGTAGQAYLDQAMLDGLLERAAAVVTHGGPGMIMDAHLAGHVPVVVPRDPHHGEHVDDHQVRFTERLALGGGIHRTLTETEFRREVRAAIGAGHASVLDRGPDATTCRRFGELVAATQQRRLTHAGR